MKEKKDTGAMYLEKSEIKPVFVVGYAISVKNTSLESFTVSVSAWDKAFGLLLKNSNGFITCKVWISGSYMSG